jgi:hypothetical protein
MSLAAGGVALGAFGELQNRPRSGHVDELHDVGDHE